MDNSETIAAISTPPGEGGIGIIRISGPAARQISLKVFSPARSLKGLEERRLIYGTMTGPSGKGPIDSGFFVFMKGPRSYTGEDTVELYCHGGPLVLKKALEAILKGGARLAEPGEFTKRAFLNGKLDLAQAESVIDLIRAETESSLSAARGRLEGHFSKKVNAIKKVLLDLAVRIEAELDFPEDVSAVTGEFFTSESAKAREDLVRLICTYDEGRVLKDGVRVLILGRPNVGKSSLLNVLLKEERAIVTSAPGTTRDIIEEVLNIRGIPVRLMDTAGLRDSDDLAESIGVKAARQRISSADMILFVVDSSLYGIDRAVDEDLTLLEELEGKKIIVTANKSDLAGEDAREALKKLFDARVRFISALNSTGIEELKDAIYEEALGRGQAVLDREAGELVASLRHRVSLERSLEGLIRSMDAFNAGLPRELVATDLRWAIDRLGEITGETTTEDILDRIFSGFCIGK